jgi:hypothetical protein
MSGIESYYRIGDLTPTPTGYFPANIQSPQGNVSLAVFIVYFRNQLELMVVTSVCTHNQQLQWSSLRASAKYGQSIVMLSLGAPCQISQSSHIIHHITAVQ